MTSPGPLFAKRRTRQPKALKLPAPKEHVLHFSVRKLLDDFLRPDWIYTHPPMGELRDPITAAKVKRMGAKPGWADFILVAPGGRMHALELKRAGGRLSEHQQQFRDDCMRLGVPHAVVFDTQAALETLSAWGALRLTISNGVPTLGGEQ